VKKNTLKKYETKEFFFLCLAILSYFSFMVNKPFDVSTYGQQHAGEPCQIFQLKLLYARVIKIEN
jgi:hypothetical protein